LLTPHTEDFITPLLNRFPDQIIVIKDKPGLEYHADASKAERLREVMTLASHHNAVLTATSAPENLGIYANEGTANPAELTVDLVNYNYDLTTDRIIPVTHNDFTITLTVPQIKSANRLSVESITYDESAQGNTLRQRLDAGHFSKGDGSVTVRVPPFNHYQVLRLSITKP
jgi:hypothetical protein